MSAIRISRLKTTCSGKSASRFDIRSSSAYASKSYHTGESGYGENREKNGTFRTMSSRSSIYAQKTKSSRFDAYFSSSLLGNSNLRRSVSFAGTSPLINSRLFSSASEGKGNITRPDFTVDSSPNENNFGGDWIEKSKEAFQSAVDAVKFTSEKAKEASSEVTPHVEQWLDTHPYLRDVIVPVGGTLTGTLLAWSLLPNILKRLHRYSTQSSIALLSGSSFWGPVPYEKSFWGALEDPIRYFITFLAFLQIGEMVAPTVILSEYVAQAWRGATIASLVWFLHRWKTNVITRALAAKSLEGGERDKLLTLDKISSVGLFVVGVMAAAEASGVAVQSILTVGGVGGVATAFASRDVLSNVLSGLSIQFSQPFSVGDIIKAGSVEGQVVEMGLTTTSLLTAERFPVIVPNSLFSSQVIVNKSRAKWRSIVKTIPVQIVDFEKISQISEDIKTMLRSNSNVFLEKEAPYCFLSRIERFYAELTVGCNLKHMGKDAEQDILLQAVRIIKQHGANLGSTQDDNFI